VDETIARVLQGTATDAEVRELSRWRKTSEANERHYQALARVWQATGEATQRRPGGPRPKADDLIRTLDHRPAHPRRFSLPIRPRRVFAAGFATAALILLTIFQGSPRSVVEGDPHYGATEFVTGDAEQVTARLADGSVVRLAPRSRLRVSGTREGREVWLDGRAFFAVASDPSRPFRVRTRAGEALVLGTRFDIRVEDDDLELIVVEGRVSVAAAGEEVHVQAGQVSRVTDGLAPSVEAAGDLQPALAWLSGFLVFESTPLRDVAIEIERHYQIRVVIPDSALAERTITALFVDRSAREVISSVCRIAAAHCSIRDSVASIEP
jgi:transmembrane sensor